MTCLRALIATLRIANAPSVVSNVWLGYMLGWSYWGGNSDPFAELGKLISIGLCLYFAGNLANDWFDRKWDEEHRPERALPSGLFSPFTYIVGASFLSLNGILAAATISYPVLFGTLGILLLIGAYTVLHKRTSWAVIPMGLCRAGLYVMGFVSQIPFYWLQQLGPNETVNTEIFDLKSASHLIAFITTHAFGLLIYIAGLSLAARYESTEHPPHGMVVLSRAMLFLPLAALSSWWMIYYPVPALIGIIPFSLWLWLSLVKFRHPVPVLVSALLAGIPLIDFIAAFPLASSQLTPDQSLLDRPILFLTAVIPLIAFALGRLLQRVSPAT